MQSSTCNVMSVHNSIYHYLATCTCTHDSTVQSSFNMEIWRETTYYFNTIITLYFKTYNCNFSVSPTYKLSVIKTVNVM